MRTLVLEAGKDKVIEFDIEDATRGDEAIIKHYVEHAKRFMGINKVTKAYFK